MESEIIMIEYDKSEKMKNEKRKKRKRGGIETKTDSYCYSSRLDCQFRMTSSSVPKVDLCDA